MRNLPWDANSRNELQNWSPQTVILENYQRGFLKYREIEFYLRRYQEVLSYVSRHDVTVVVVSLRSLGFIPAIHKITQPGFGRKANLTWNPGWSPIHYYSS